MCVKLSFGDSNFGLYPPHPTSTYTCAVTIIQRMCSGDSQFLKNLSFCENQWFDIKESVPVLLELEEFDQAL